MSKTKAITGTEAITETKAITETEVIIGTEAREKIIAERGKVLNNLANIEKKWQVLENVSEQKFEINWKKRSIKKVRAEKPELQKTINKCKEHLFTELARLNALLDQNEIQSLRKSRLDAFLKKEEAIIKATRIDSQIINGSRVGLDVLLEAEKINKEKIKELTEKVENEKFQIKLEAMSFLNSL